MTGHVASAQPAYAVVIEQAGQNWSAYVPDLPGCVSTGATAREAVANIREAIELHIEGMIEDGEPVPPPTTLATMVSVAPAGSGGASGEIGKGGLPPKVAEAIIQTGTALPVAETKDTPSRPDAERDPGEDSLGSGAVASVGREAGWRGEGEQPCPAGPAVRGAARPRRRSPARSSTRPA